MRKRLRPDYLIMLGVFVLNLLFIWRFFAVPFPTAFSAPVVPTLARGLEIFGADSAWAVRWVLLVFYSFGPLSLFFLVREVAGRRMAAVLAAIVYSLPILRSRFEALVSLGDGAHIAALTLIPLAAFSLLRFLKSGSFGSAVLASLAILLVALTSPFGLFALFSVLLVVTFSEMLLGYGRLKLFRFVLVVVFAFGLSGFWYNPEFIRLSLFSPSGRAVVLALKNLIPLSFFLVPVLGTFGFLLFDKRPNLQPLFVALGLTIVFGLISFAGGLSPMAISAQSRYLPELAMSIAFLWGVVGSAVYGLLPVLPQGKWFPVPMGKRKLVRKGLVAAFVVFCLVAVFLSPFQEMPSSRRSGRLVVGITKPVVSGLGEVREQTGPTDRLVGYGISFITVVVIGILGIWLKREGHQVKS